jgi:hypothetical protein
MVWRPCCAVKGCVVSAGARPAPGGSRQGGFLPAVYSVSSLQDACYSAKQRFAAKHEPDHKIRPGLRGLSF